MIHFGYGCAKYKSIQFFFFESSRLHVAAFRIVNKAIQLCDCMRVCVCGHSLL